MLQNILVNGFIYGALYALLAVGFALVFGVARLANFAHTAFYMVAAFLLYFGTAGATGAFTGAYTAMNLPVLPVAIIAVLIPVLIAAGYYAFILDRVKYYNLAVVILTIALAMFFQQIFIIWYGGMPKGVNPFISGYTEIIGVRVQYQQLISVGACLITVAIVVLVLTWTKWGQAIRAVSQDMEAANLMGIDVGKIYLITISLSAALAAFAGVITAPLITIQPFMWSNPLNSILAACVLGGMGSIKGSIAGAVVLAFAEVIVVALVPGGGYLRGVVALVVMIFVLLFKPEGLFGVVFEEERL